MSDQTTYKTTQKYVAAGVFKIDYMSAGFPELKKIAQEWAKDSNFYELIIRGVSEKNYGIQFVYISDNARDENIKKYKNELIEKFGREKGGLYAWDYNEGTYESDEDEPKLDEIVVLKGLKQN